MKKTRPSKNDILKQNLPLWRCSESQAVCVYGLNCRFSIACFIDDGDAHRIAVCQSKPNLKLVSPRPCVMIPIFNDIEGS